MRGTLTYYSNPRLLELRSRVVRATGPGLLRIRVVGQNALGHVRYATVEVQIRGRPSEIVNSRMIPDWPDVNNWELDDISFIPGEPERNRSRSVR